jgi:shikimate dehydrogenase
MHHNALSACGLNGIYLPFDLSTSDLKAALTGLRELGFKGLNVTIPLKLAVIDYLTDLSPEAKAIGAVNTLVPSEGGYCGHNTDASGFADAYLSNLKQTDRTLILGTGGAARAVAQALVAQGFKASISGRNFERTLDLAEDFSLEPLEWAQACVSGPWDLIVNSTAASSPDELGDSPPRPLLVPGGLMIDINHNRPKNYWQDLALASKASFVNGLAMLAAQARRSFKLWTGLDPGLGVFRSAFPGLTVRIGK